MDGPLAVLFILKILGLSCILQTLCSFLCHKRLWKSRRQEGEWRLLLGYPCLGADFQQELGLCVTAAVASPSFHSGIWLCDCPDEHQDILQRYLCPSVWLSD